MNPHRVTYHKPLTTSIIAEILHLSKKSVLLYLQKGALESFRTIGGHFRVWPADLDRFIKKHGFNIPFSFHEIRKICVLLISDSADSDTHMVQRMISSFSLDPKVVCAEDEYSGCVEFGKTRPHVAVIRLSALSEASCAKVISVFSDYKTPIFVIEHGSMALGTRRLFHQHGADVVPNADLTILETKLRACLENHSVGVREGS